MTKSEFIIYDGSAGSVEKIIDVVGTRGVNNASGRCYLPKNQWLEKNSTNRRNELWFDETHWWIGGRAYEKYKKIKN